MIMFEDEVETRLVSMSNMVKVVSNVVHALLYTSRSYSSEGL